MASISYVIVLETGISNSHEIGIKRRKVSITPLQSTHTMLMCLESFHLHIEKIWPVTPSFMKNAQAQAVCSQSCGSCLETLLQFPNGGFMLVLTCKVPNILAPKFKLTSMELC